MSFPYRFEKAEHESKLEQKHRRLINKSDFIEEWESLLEKCVSEAEVQKFIERYPFVLPGLRDLHHGPIWDVIVSQFPLGADFVPDFVFLTANSGLLQYTFVEIESPKKPIFNKDDSISAKFQQGFQQVRDWHGWVKRHLPLLQDMFSDLLEGEQYPYPYSKFYYVCGRRDDVQRTSRRRRRWEDFIVTLAKDFEVMTYDRLTDALENMLTLFIVDRYVVCTYKNGSFVVKPTSLEVST